MISLMVNGEEKQIDVDPAMRFHTNRFATHQFQCRTASRGTIKGVARVIGAAANTINSLNSTICGT